jgi:hypothetical protein
MQSNSTTYLFQCGDEGLFAMSPDKTGETIPRSSCTQGWLLRQEFQLGTHDPLLTPVEPAPIIRAINAKGYYIWRDPCWAQRETHWLISATRLPLSRRESGGALGLQKENGQTSQSERAHSGAVGNHEGP